MIDSIHCSKYYFTHFVSIFCNYISTSFLINPYFQISNDLASLLYLALVNGDNNFICRSSARQMP
jgi:hypothetical protein